MSIPTPTPTHNPKSKPKPYNLAIIGGGIAGCLLSIGLTSRQIPHTLYESASQFGEIGAGVGFDAHKVRTMALIAPEIRDAYLRCTEVPDDEDPVWFTVRVGDLRRGGDDGMMWTKGNGGKEGRPARIGEPVFDVPARPGPRGGVHRAHFLDEVIKLIPAHVPKFRRKVVGVTEADDGSGEAVVFFADGSSARHSAVLGCDGIKSRTREIVLGKKEAKPLFSGKYAYRGLIPMEQAMELEGVGDESRKGSQMYMGYHGHVLTFPIAKGSILNGTFRLFVNHLYRFMLIEVVVAFSSRESWTDPEWVVTNSREDMLADYDTWNPTVKAIISAMQKPDIWVRNPAIRIVSWIRDRRATTGVVFSRALPRGLVLLCIPSLDILSLTSYPHLLGFVPPPHSSDVLSVPTTDLPSRRCSARNHSAPGVWRWYVRRRLLHSERAFGGDRERTGPRESVPSV
jgi:salicylate hydroxylase